MIDEPVKDPNSHHTESHIYKSEGQWYNDMLGRGKGDPDMHGYPGESDEDFLSQEEINSLFVNISDGTNQR